jgi:DNA-binding XRE family transcriptional regulator
MVTRIRQHAKPRLFLKEHREAKGISAEVMAGRLGIARESVYRLEREWRTRCTPDKQAAYAAALQLEPEALWRPPATPDLPSLDAMVEDQPGNVRDMAVDIVRRLVGKAG